MADLEWLGEPDRASLRRAIRHRLRHLDPTLRVVAEGFLAEQSEIDLLAVGNEGELVSIRIGRRGGDAVLLTQALSDLTWLRPRREHLLKLAPGLGLEPSAEPRALLLCPNFAPETCSAAENLPARTVGRLSYRCLRLQGQLNVLLTDEADPERARPSGTEPKIKFYLFTRVAADAIQSLDSAKSAMQERIDGYTSDMQAYADAV